MSWVTPRYAIKVPRVTMNELSPIFQWMMPLSAPPAMPTTSPTATAGTGPIALATSAVLIAVRAVSDPTDRSKLPLMSRTVMPMARIPVSIIWSSKLLTLDEAR